MGRTNTMNKDVLRKFGWLMAGAFGALGLIALYKGRYNATLTFFAVSVVFLAAGSVYPRALGPVYRWWMRFAGALAWVNTRVLLSLLFYAVLTPVSFIFRVIRRDALELKMDRGRMTYWHKREHLKPARERYEHLY